MRLASLGFAAGTRSSLRSNSACIFWISSLLSQSHILTFFGRSGFFFLLHLGSLHGNDHSAGISEDANTTGNGEFTHMDSIAERREGGDINLKPIRNLAGQRLDFDRRLRMDQHASQMNSFRVADQRDLDLSVNRTSQVDLVELDMLNLVGHGVALDFS